MPICCQCFVKFTDVKSLMVHLKLVHDKTENSEYKCAETHCYRNFSSLNSFKKHLKVHTAVKVTTVTSHISARNIPNVASSSDYNDLCEDLSETEPKPSIANSEIDRNSEEFFEQTVRENALFFVSQLYADLSFSRKDVQMIIDSVTHLLEVPIKIFEEFLTGIIQTSDIIEPDKVKINKYFSVMNGLFKGLHTEYYRFKHLEKTHYYINPTEYIVGERFDTVKSGVTLPKNYTAQFIPIQKVLTNFFHLPNVLKDTLNYIEKLENEHEITNIIQTDFWKTKIEIISDKDIIFPIFIYFDDFECGNPLGSHAGIHKLGAIYCSIPCIPPTFQGHLENIFLTLLFHSADLKEFGKNKILLKLVEELIFLETKGINIIDETERNIKFCFALLLGDNLGINSILGFVESFRANYYCRFCKSSRIEMQEQEIENNAKLRNVINYDTDVKLKNFSLTGIKEDSIFNKIPSFHVTSNFCVDIAHDIFEGIALFDFTEIMYQFVINDKLFDIETLNSCMKVFNYSWESNKPPLITLDNLKKKKINMSCAEMKTLILYAGLIFGHLIPVGNIYWKVYIFLRKMLSIILSSSVSIEKCASLKKLIKEHHSLYKRLFNLPLKPKHHNLVHYPTIMMNSGPLNNTSSLRYESKHREGKLSANVVSSRTNITKTLAIKHQLKICHRFLSMAGFQNMKAETNDSLQDISSLLCTFVTGFQFNELPTFKHFYLCKKLVIGNTIYKKDDTIIIEHKVLPVFGNISFILKNTEGKYCFIFKQIKIINFTEHFFAYEVQVSEVLNYTLNIDYFPHVVLCKHSNKKNYITIF